MQFFGTPLPLILLILLVPVTIFILNYLVSKNKKLEKFIIETEFDIFIKKKGK